MLDGDAFVCVSLHAWLSAVEWVCSGVGTLDGVWKVACILRTCCGGRTNSWRQPDSCGTGYAILFSYQIKSNAKLVEVNLLTWITTGVRVTTMAALNQCKRRRVWNANYCAALGTSGCFFMMRARLQYVCGISVWRICLPCTYVCMSLITLSTLFADEEASLMHMPNKLVFS